MDANYAPLRRYLTALVVVGAAIAISMLATRLLPHANLSLFFLTAVLVASVRGGLGPSLLASLSSFLAYNYFFTAPFYTLRVQDEGDVATLLLFFLVAVIAGNLAARLRREAAASDAALQRISNLFEFSRRLTSASDGVQVAAALAEHVARLLGCPVVVCSRGQDGELDELVRTGHPEGLNLAQVEQCLLDSASACRALSASGYRLYRLETDRGLLGVMLLYRSQVPAAQQELICSLSEQASLALDRILIAGDLEQARVVSETEQLRSALLSSVSHDLRTPLASIIGSTTSLIEYGDVISGENREDLLKTVVDEARRLDRYIQNLLDMTRLGRGELQLQRDWVDLNDILSSAIERLYEVPESIDIHMQVASDVPLVWVHAVLLEQAFFNILDNAVKYSPLPGEISVRATVNGDMIEVRVCDQGPGIPASEGERIFDMFYTVKKGDRAEKPGTGLGLAICRGLIGAHGGEVTVQHAEHGLGACILVRLPIIEPENGERDDGF